MTDNLSTQALVEQLQRFESIALEECRLIDAENYAEAAATLERVERRNAELEAAIESNTKALGFAQNGRCVAEAQVEALRKALEVVRQSVNEDAAAGWRVKTVAYINKTLATLSAPAEARSEQAGGVLVPVEPTYEQIRAMSESVARDDEGEFPPLSDLIDCSGENKTHTILRAAYRAAIAAATSSPKAEGDHG